MSENLRVPAVTAVDRPRWSVVIPVHNCAGYLAQALPEVLAQISDRDDTEIIVVDDASSDEPARVVERLGGGRVTYRPNPRHLGAVNTFNRCVELATGELVHLLHGDDAVLPGFYPAMERALADPTAIAAVCRVQDVDARNTPTYVSRSYRSGTGVWTNALDALAVSNRVRAPGIVVRRAAYEQVGGYRSDLPHGADWEMWTRLAAHGPVVFVDEVLASYRRHDTSDTSTRVRSGANVRERVTVIGVLGGYVAPNRRARTARRALAYAVVFATRTALSLLRAGEWGAAARQGREAVRCAWLLPRGVPIDPALSGNPRSAAVDRIATVGAEHEEEAIRWPKHRP